MHCTSDEDVGSLFGLAVLLNKSIVILAACYQAFQARESELNRVHSIFDDHCAANELSPVPLFEPKVRCLVKSRVRLGYTQTFFDRCLVATRYFCVNVRKGIIVLVRSEAISEYSLLMFQEALHGHSRPEKRSRSYKRVETLRKTR